MAQYQQLEKRIDEQYEFTLSKVDRRLTTIQEYEEKLFWILSHFEDEELTFEEANQEIDNNWEWLRSIEYKGN